MSSNATDHDDIEAPEEFEVPGTFYTFALAMVGIGAAAFLIGAFALENPRRAWNAYLIGYWFTLGLGLAGPFIVATQYLSTASWYISIRRVPEAFGNFLMPAAALGIVMLAGAPQIMPWMRLDQKDIPHHALHVIGLKVGFLNMTGLTLTTILAPLVLLGIAYWMRRNSLEQDESGDPGLFEQNKTLSAIFLLCFGVGFSLLSWYWMLSLEPLWYATMWQVYNFAGLFQTGLAVTTIVVLILYRNDAFGDLVGEHQIHSLGQLVFAFTVFYAYIAFCQFMLCWYANIPEESLFYIRRLGGLHPAQHPGGYGWFTALWIGKFIAPFLILLPQDIKKNERNILYYVCWLIALTQIYEIWYWVAFAPANPAPATEPTLYVPWLEIPIVLGFVGLFMIVVARSLAAADIVPLKDPFVHEVVEHGHHHDEEPDDDWAELLQSS